MKTSTKIKLILTIICCCFLMSCEDFLEIEAPDHKITSESVFEEDQTALSAMTGIYNQLAAVPFSSGGPASVTVLTSLSTDELTPYRTTNLPYMEFEQHEILPNNFRNYNLWSSAYQVIYMTNSLLEGLENSNNISEDIKFRLEGEARFVRAFTYFYLVNLYGGVPLVLTTDYDANALAVRNSEAEVYEQIISDLLISIDLLNGTFSGGERTQVNSYTAKSLLARVQLYLENWEQAEKLSGEVISQSGTYKLLDDLDKVFLANSREAIWQLSPKGGGSGLTNTKEGATFIIHPILSFLASVKLEESFLSSFEEGDKRRLHWIGYHQRSGNYYPFKYKIDNSTEDESEYSMVLRLAEQYLIRAEARLMSGNLAGAISDLDRIRGRAGLELISDTNPGISAESLLKLIMKERKRELFTEWGHRWLDLKRTEKAGEVLRDDNSLWKPTDVLYPIPAKERMKNPNLNQNDGY